jgi:hypothetical protein
MPLFVEQRKYIMIPTHGMVHASTLVLVLLLTTIVRGDIGGPSTTEALPSADGACGGGRLPANVTLLTKGNDIGGGPSTMETGGGMP